MNILIMEYQGLSAGRTYSIVSSGTEFFQVPVRVGTDSEVVLIRIRGTH